VLPLPEQLGQTEDSAFTFCSPLPPQARHGLRADLGLTPLPEQ
jgi:hypothetical protein